MNGIRHILPIYGRFIGADHQIKISAVLFCIVIPAAASDGENRKEVPVVPGNNLAYFYNPQASGDKTILILHDSFLDNRESYYYGRPGGITDTWI